MGTDAAADEEAENEEDASTTGSKGKKGKVRGCLREMALW